MMLRQSSALTCLLVLFTACGGSERGTPGDDDGSDMIDGVSGSSASSSGASGSGNGSTVSSSSSGVPMGPASSDESLAQQQQQWGWGASVCPATPAGVSSGYGTGEQLAGLTLLSCDGSEVSLDAICGAQASWIMFAHGWCPHCRLASQLAEGVYQQFAGENLAVVNVLVESATGDPPTPQDCHNWREAYAQDRVITLYDPNGASVVLWEQNYTALSVFLDEDRVIVNKLHTDVESQIVAAIEAAR
jgi:thiol-disulfide isomerase/thioredoxin